MDEMVERANDRLARGSRSFASAAALLPPRERASMVLLYSWCRHCDDVIDDEVLGYAVEKNDGVPIGVRVDRLRLETIAALRGEARHPEFRALQRVALEHKLPDRYPLELIRGMAMDAAGTHYRTIEDTLSYCYHVAGVVGVMSAIILGVRDRPTLERASDLGIGFQLTNIARDVIADARRGRVYLPSAWLEDEGIRREDLSSQGKRRALFRVVERLLLVSDDYYRSASAGIAHLPLRSAWAVAAARRIYFGIGTRVRQRGAASWDTRIATDRWQKVLAGSLALAESAVLTSSLKSATSREGLWTPDTLFA